MLSLDACDTCLWIGEALGSRWKRNELAHSPLPSGEKGSLGKRHQRIVTDGPKEKALSHSLVHGLPEQIGGCVWVEPIMLPGHNE